jgi:hypothetical protein
MKIWHHHPQTKILIGEGEADTSPLDPGEFLIPAFATSLPPPAPQDGYEIVFTGQDWAFEEIPQPPDAPPPPPPPPPPTDVSFWQFMMAAWKLNFITHAEALAAVRQRIMPPAFAQAISDLPAEAKLAAELKFAGITRMLRSDLLFGLVVQANIATDEQIDGVFAVAAAIT